MNDILTLKIYMITSSNFFQKAFFTIDSADQGLQNDFLSPWDLSQKPLKSFECTSKHKSISPEKVQKITNDSSKKHIEQKLRAKSILTKPQQSNLPTLKQQSRYLSMDEAVQKKPHQLNKPKIFPHYHSTKIVEMGGKKKKESLFPQLNVHQYRELYAKGNNPKQNEETKDDILGRKKSRRKFMDDIIKHRKIQNKDHSERIPLVPSIPSRSVVSGKYVCALKHPNFNVTGIQTNTFIDDIQ